jgi:hypothetical protein
MPPFVRHSVEYLTRRGFLRGLVALAAFLPVPGIWGRPAVEHRIPLRALAPYLDTLLPEDATPSATQLGTDGALLEQALERRDVARLLELGCSWLDAQARDRGATEFSELDEGQRAAVVAIAERSPSDSMPRAFFSYTQSEAFFHYYAQPGAWPELGFSGPPQPMGFLDFAQPPKVPG